MLNSIGTVLVRQWAVPTAINVAVYGYSTKLVQVSYFDVNLDELTLVIVNSTFQTGADPSIKRYY